MPPTQGGAFAPAQGSGGEDQAGHTPVNGLERGGSVFSAIEKGIGGKGRQLLPEAAQHGEPPPRSGKTSRPRWGKQGERLFAAEMGEVGHTMQDHCGRQHHGLTLSSPSPKERGTARD